MVIVCVNGWYVVVLYFCSCSGEINCQLCFYYFVDSVEVDWILCWFVVQYCGFLVVVGVLFGGNVLLCWFGEYCSDMLIVCVVVVILMLIDVYVGGCVLLQGFVMVYICSFLKMFKCKVFVKFDQYLGLFDCDVMLQVVMMCDFDEVVIVLLYGFVNVDDYWMQVIMWLLLFVIDVLMLIFNVCNDLFLLELVLLGLVDVLFVVEFDQFVYGGYVGFMIGLFFGCFDWLLVWVFGYCLKFVDYG